jgi:hypothetical protein
VLGDNSLGRYYDDGNRRSSGTSDYAVITDFNAGDKLQLDGAAANYVQRAVTLEGVSSMGVYHDSNANGIYDSRDELIAVLKGITAPVGADGFLYV